MDLFNAYVADAVTKESKSLVLAGIALPALMPQPYQPYIIVRYRDVGTYRFQRLEGPDCSVPSTARTLLGPEGL